VSEPWFVRLLGASGLMLVVVGMTVVLFNLLQGPRFISQTLGVMVVFLGVIGMLIHAISDSDMQVRRLYGMFAVVLLAVSLLLAVVPTKAGWGALLFPYATSTLVLALMFLVAHARHEDDAGFTKLIGLILLGAAALLILSTLVISVVRASYLPGYGLILGMLGLVYLTATTCIWDSSTDQGYMIGRAMAGIGGLMIVFAIIRTLFASTDPFFVPSGMILMVMGGLYIIVSLGLISELQLIVMTRRELTSFFYTPVGYLVFIGLAFSGWLNYAYFAQSVMIQTQRVGGVAEPIVGDYLFGLLPVVIAIFVVPAITMRLMSEESRTGTMEVLLTAPVTEWSIVLSKFISCLIFFLLLWIPMMLYLVNMYLVSGVPFDYRPLLSFGVALTVTGATFVAMGLFFSSLSKNQIIAAVMTFFGMMVLLFAYIGQMAEVGSMWKEVLRHISFLTIWQESLSGRLPLRDLVLHASVAAFWLFLTVKVIESRKWK